MKQLTLIFLMIFVTGLTAIAQDLSRVEQLHSRFTGYGGIESPTYKIFKTQLEHGDKAREVFRRCLTGGTPAARLYGAVGLWKLDPREGEKALTSLVGDKEEVRLLNGCLMTQHTVGEVARDLLSERPGIISLSAF